MEATANPRTPGGLPLALRARGIPLEAEDRWAYDELLQQNVWRDRPGAPAVIDDCDEALYLKTLQRVGGED